MDIPCFYQGCVFLVISLLASLCLLSGKAKFYVKYYLYIFNLGLISTVVVFLSLLTPGNLDNFRYFYPPLGILGWILGIRFEVRGAHHMPKDKPCIFVMNHQNLLEPLGAGITFKNVFNVTMLAGKENLVFKGPFSLATWLCGCIFIDRYNHKNALKTMEKCAHIISTKQVKLVIFPEGTIATKTDSFLPFKKGAFNLAVKAQAPVAPVVISTFNHVFSVKERKFETGKVIITCLPPVPTYGLTLQDVNYLTENIRRNMLEVYKRTNDELLVD